MKEAVIDLMKVKYGSLFSLTNDHDFGFQDDVQEFTTKKKGVKAYWVSFLDGRQRVLLFTQDLAVATMASKPYELERVEQQYTMSLQSVNISLINNLTGQELASMAIAR